MSRIIEFLGSIFGWHFLQRKSLEERRQEPIAMVGNKMVSLDTQIQTYQLMINLIKSWKDLGFLSQEDARKVGDLVSEAESIYQEQVQLLATNPDAITLLELQAIVLAIHRAEGLAYEAFNLINSREWEFKNLPFDSQRLEEDIARITTEYPDVKTESSVLLARLCLLAARLSYKEKEYPQARHFLVDGNWYCRRTRQHLAGR